MAIDTGEEKLNLFENVYTPAGEEKNKHWLYTPKVVYTLSAVMLFLFILVFYAVDVAKPGAIEKHIKASASEADINLLMERQKLKKVIAQQRPDILDLLTEITASAQSDQSTQRGGRGGRGGRGQNSGIQLESFHFKKGLRVTITGTAANNDQLYDFERSLEERTDIHEVGRSVAQSTLSANINGGSRSGTRGGSRGTKFTITFHYKNFTK